MINVHCFDKNDRCVLCLHLPDSYSDKSIDDLSINFINPLIESLPEWLYYEIVEYSISWNCRKEKNETEDLFN